MAINIRARFRNAMVGLSLALCLVFTLILFVIVFTTEDRVFVNQLSAEKTAYKQHQKQFPSSKWVPSNQRFQLIESSELLPTTLTRKAHKRIARSTGIHEYFDSRAAYFIDHFHHFDTGASQFLIYDVSDFLAVRGNKLSIFMSIIILTIVVTVCAVFIAHRLVNRTLEPVRKLSYELQHAELDDVVIELANEFSEDEVGVLAHELAAALSRARNAAKREYEFNQGISHELRSPIQIAQSATELLELHVEKVAENEDSQIGEYVSRLRRSMTEMNEIAEAFLWLASDQKPGLNDVYCVATLGNTVAAVQAMYPISDIKFDSSLAQDYGFALPEKIGAVIVRNLLRNAISHGDNKPIRLILTEDSISVINHVRADSEQEQGFGIGLSIVKRLCERSQCQFSTQINQDNSHKASVSFKDS